MASSKPGPSHALMPKARASRGVSSCQENCNGPAPPTLLGNNGAKLGHAANIIRRALYAGARRDTRRCCHSQLGLELQLFLPLHKGLLLHSTRCRFSTLASNVGVVLIVVTQRQLVNHVARGLCVAGESRGSAKPRALFENQPAHQALSDQAPSSSGPANKSACPACGC